MPFTASDGTEFEDRDAWRQYEFETNFTFKNKKDETLTKFPGQIQGQPFDLADLENCQVFLLDHCDQVQIDNLVNCRVYVGPCSESVFVRNCQNCFFTIACKQLRTRDCSQIQVSLYSLTDPIIETSNNVLFSTFNAAYYGLRQQFTAANLEPENNHWTQVYDFNDPNKTGENWKLSHDAVEPFIIPLEQMIENAEALGRLENPVPANAQPIAADGGSLQSFSLDTTQEAATAAVYASEEPSSQSPPPEDEFVPAPQADSSFYEESNSGFASEPVSVPSVAETPVFAAETPPPVDIPPVPAASSSVPPPAPQSWPAMDEFESKLAAEVEQRRVEESTMIDQVKSQATLDLEKYYKERADKLAHRASSNREAEEEKKKTQELLENAESPWHRVTDLVDTTVAPPKSKTDSTTDKKDSNSDLYDTSRMRSLLLHLKNSGQATH
ncbi:unnamed protein product [Aphanomyces euteiches]|uniref:Clathrin light chain n=1 Tax=Aphanomyces euteiches TaxID=100861 RepID=A0A6G0WFC6_9STRA|nr:hypothetical protein Ae201684_015657 [Aphanomyces euteiches]KAH9093915.1 hypothetical protein Ae201684P_016535 [Aphanomyces euteiches]KAH9141446.1 hypothetical protein AeRB84_014388 [Aphanomyces euteiches]